MGFSFIILNDVACYEILIALNGSLKIQIKHKKITV